MQAETHTYKVKVIYIHGIRKKYAKMFSGWLIWGGRIIVDFCSLNFFTFEYFLYIILTTKGKNLKSNVCMRMNLEYTCQNVEALP